MPNSHFTGRSPSRQNTRRQQSHGPYDGQGGQQFPAQQDPFLVVSPGAGRDGCRLGQGFIHPGVPLLFQPGFFLSGRLPGRQVDDIILGLFLLGGTAAEMPSPDTIISRAVRV